jgi:hypothetical protein
MKTIIDIRKVNRRSTTANVASIGGLLGMLAGVLLSLYQPGLSTISTAIMIIGLGTAMVGIYFANRWVRKPRPEESLGKALKSLNDSYRLYHYPALACEHILLGPNGLYVFHINNLGGYFSYRNGRWSERMTLGRALRSIVEEPLGDPVKTVQGYQQYLVKMMGENVSGGKMIPVTPVVVFTHSGANLDVESAPVAVVKIDKIRRLISSKTSRLDPGLLEQITDFLNHKCGN